MWSHQPAGRPVIGMTSCPAPRSRSIAAYAAAVSRPCVDSVSSMSEARRGSRAPLPRHRGQRLHRRCVHWTTFVLRTSVSALGRPCGLSEVRDRAPDVRGDAGRRGVGHPEPALRPPPQHVVGRARPLLAHQVVDLGRGEAVAEVLAEIGRLPGGAQHRARRARRAGARGPQQVGRQRRIAPHQIGAAAPAAPPRQVAAGERRVLGPRAASSTGETARARRARARRACGRS